MICNYLEVIWYCLEAIHFRLRGDYVCIDSKCKCAYTLECTALPRQVRAHIGARGLAGPGSAHIGARESAAARRAWVGRLRFPFYFLVVSIISLLQ